MKAQDSATARTSIAVADPAQATTADRADALAPRYRSPAAGRSGTLLAALGVVAFSLTFPSTVWGLESFGPWSLVAVRSVLAAVVAGGFLLALRVPLPESRRWAGLAVVAGGVVIGFPLLTTLALRTSTTSHAAVVVGLLPLTTAAFAALRTGRRPSRAFWLAALGRRGRGDRLHRAAERRRTAEGRSVSLRRAAGLRGLATPRAAGWLTGCRAGT